MYYPIWKIIFDNYELAEWAINNKSIKYSNKLKNIIKYTSETSYLYCIYVEDDPDVRSKFIPEYKELYDFHNNNLNNKHRYEGLLILDEAIHDSLICSDVLKR